MRGEFPGIPSAQEVQHSDELPDTPQRQPRTQRDGAGLQSGGDNFVQSILIIGVAEGEQAAKATRNQGSDPT